MGLKISVECYDLFGCTMCDTLVCLLTKWGTPLTSHVQCHMLHILHRKRTFDDDEEISETERKKKQKTQQQPLTKQELRNFS